MRSVPVVAVVALSLIGCSQGSSEPSAEPQPDPNDTSMPAKEVEASPKKSESSFQQGAWDMVSSDEGDGLFFGAGEGQPARLHLFCGNDGGLLANVNAFRPVSSEERMTFGAGDTLITLVADSGGDTQRGGVSGTAGVPGNLLALLTGAEGVRVNYGSQNLGPLPPVPEDLAASFVQGCAD